ncbi:DNA mismatch repair protein MutS [Peptoniphilus obesi]|uniref:DNA mismatch repair protein MutS n=1 Tax=Peptoniphilus obesi TaxID=1472765 RepID=UPI00055ED460|nr:DNA mismatch repair protein MutS [Peptoniphilus obesi]
METKLTPMMKQYLEVKEKHQDEILLFRLGDFYEMFFDDAILVSKELDLTLTKRATTKNDVPMCGFPYHVSDSYISKLINRGHKVAICEQVEDPKLAKSIVKREVIKILTPGTFTDSNYLNNRDNNYLLAAFLTKTSISISYVDYSTGDFYVTEKNFLSFDKLLNFFVDEFYKINPSELLINNLDDKNFKKILSKFSCYINYYSTDQNIDLEKYTSDLLGKNILNDLKDLKNTKKITDFTSINLLLNYLSRTQKISLKHINSMKYYDLDEYMSIDEASRRNLELVNTINSSSKSYSLLGVLDNCKTSMGSRELKRWIEEPLKNKEIIENRYDVIDSFCSDFILLDDLIKKVNKIYDIERLCVKISNDTINPKDLISLKLSLKNILDLKQILSNSDKEILIKIADQIDPLLDVIKEIDEIIIEDPPANYEEKQYIKRSYSEELANLFDISQRSKEWILEFEQEEREKTGIKNLRIKYNKILGYFIEVTKSFIDKIPENYIRKQTLVGSERYFSIELKEMESKLLSSKDEALDLQSEIFSNLKKDLSNNISKIQNLSKTIAKIDILLNFADKSIKNNYVRPHINEQGILDIKDGRHPIVEKNLQEENFIANDTYLDNKENLIHIITGPNMSGKSTYMRQVALISIMAQIGSFVPASQANIFLVDKIFTRIGASDNLAQGDSTFMVEMKEVANIIKNASHNSLIILDEVGRGTSTYDGISLAWSIVEYIAEHIKAKTLFATHYHELVELSNSYDCITNLTSQVEENDGDIVFLRKIIEGYTDNSYGIEVAKLAGINKEILLRAENILDSLSKKKNFDVNLEKEYIDKKNLTKVNPELEELIKDIKNIDINSLTPINGLNLLNEIIKKVSDIDDN